MTNKICSNPSQCSHRAKIFGVVMVFCVVLLGGNMKAGATELKEQAYEAYALQKYDDAAKLFEKLYDTEKDAKWLFNAGKCHEKLGKHIKAKELYKKYLLEKPDGKHAPALSRMLQGILKVECNPSGNLVYVGAEVKGPAPISIKLFEGKYEIRCEKKGHGTKKKSITIKVGENQKLTLVLKPEKKYGVLIVAKDGALGATIKIDGKPVGKIPLEKPLWVEQGQRRVVVEKTGFTSWQKEVKVSERKAINIRPKLMPLASSKRSNTKAVIGWSSLGVGVVAEVLAWVFYAQANGYAQDSKAFSGNRDLSTGLHVSAAVTAALGAGLVTWWYLDKDKNKDTRTASSSFILQW